MKVVARTLQSIAAAGVIWVILAGPGLLADGGAAPRIVVASMR